MNKTCQIHGTPLNGDGLCFLCEHPEHRLPEQLPPVSDKQHDFGSLVCIYSQLLPRIRDAGKALGYAIAIHGTMQRDFDLLAVPWIEDASDPQELVKAISDAVGGYVIGDEIKNPGYVSDRPFEKPHGRMAWNICWGGKAFIDLSIMPRNFKKPHKEKQKIKVCRHGKEVIKLYGFPEPDSVKTLHHMGDGDWRTCNNDGIANRTDPGDAKG